jgi:hypothetical protein
VMAQSAAGTPASMIGGRPPHAFELAPRAAETAPAGRFELPRPVEPTPRLPFELPPIAPVTAEAEEELPAWARRPVVQPPPSAPPPPVVEVTPRAVVSTRRAPEVAAAGRGKTRAKGTRAGAEPFGSRPPKRPRRPR